MMPPIRTGLFTATPAFVRLRAEAASSFSQSAPACPEGLRYTGLQEYWEITED